MGGLIDIRDTFGPILLGVMVSLPLTGLTTLQSYYYFNMYPNDSRSLKLLVLVMWILDLGHSASACHFTWYYLVSEYGNPFALLKATPSLYTSTLTNLLSSVIAQAFFAKRIFILASPKTRWWLGGFIGILVALHFTFGMITTVNLFESMLITRIAELQAWVIPFSVFSVLADVVIAGCLCVMLNRRRTGFQGTNKVLNTLVLYAINRCLLTSLVAIAETIIFIVNPLSGWFMAFDLVIGKLYANALLATLNSRRKLHATSVGASAGAGSGSGATRSRDISLGQLRFASTRETGTVSALSTQPDTRAPATGKATLEHDAVYVYEGEDALAGNAGKGVLVDQETYLDFDA